jgi:hypothetical protein
MMVLRVPPVKGEYVLAGKPPPFPSLEGWQNVLASELIDPIGAQIQNPCHFTAVEQILPSLDHVSTPHA